MRWKYILLFSAIILFLAVNTYLIVKKDSKIERSVRVEEWAVVKKQNLVETMKTKGVLTPFEEYDVYFDEKNGEFKQFLVDEGDQVEPGTPLFEYSSANIDANIRELEAERDQIESEIYELEDNISELEDLQDDISYNSTNFEASLESKTQSNDVISYSIEQDILNKKLRIGQLEAEVAKYDQLISDLQEGLNQLTVNSEVSGWVKSINRDLKNPVITIISTEQKVEGLLAEEELPKVEQGMTAYVGTGNNNSKMKGTVQKISPYPEKKPSTDTKSKYPFEIHLEENKGELAHGSHVDVTLVTKEANQALTAPAKSIKRRSSVYVLSDSGKLQKQKVITGMEVKGTKEITEGVEEGQLLALKLTSRPRDGARFYTSLDTAELSKKSFKQLEKRELIAYIAKGILTR
jgi:HlyD family secretion protein